MCYFAYGNHGFSVALLHFFHNRGAGKVAKVLFLEVLIGKQPALHFDLNENDWNEVVGCLRFWRVREVRELELVQLICDAFERREVVMRT